MNSQETKKIYSFNFETKTAYINDEPLGAIVDHSDTAINVLWDDGIEQSNLLCINLLQSLIVTHCLISCSTMGFKDYWCCLSLKHLRGCFLC